LKERIIIILILSCDIQDIRFKKIKNTPM